ncbi:MAG: hypothetical protein NDI61_05955 [Bdellovibrionaceae bacterium]|nr:hypothetical protein [Pseudobdellovibrionaceae bacterium]
MKRALLIAFLVIALLTAATHQVFAAEADHYTAGRRLRDSSTRLNEMANNYLSQAIRDLNASQRCDDSQASETALYNELGKYFANHQKGQLVKDVLHRTIEGIEIFQLPIKDSIYAEWSILDGFLLGRPGAGSSQLGLSPLIRVGDTMIGVDKLEHMFGMGRTYFNYHYFDGDSLLDVLKHGIFREMTVLGGNIFATGVFSYGDLSANFNGMRFWNHVLQKRNDVLGPHMNLGPYVRCQNGQWQTTENSIDFRLYVDDSMDESINCRKFASQGGLDKSLRAMVKRNNNPAACPRVKDIATQIYRKYNLPLENDEKKRPISHWIINLDGHGVIDYKHEFDKKSILTESPR